MVRLHCTEAAGSGRRGAHGERRQQQEQYDVSPLHASAWLVG